MLTKRILDILGSGSGLVIFSPVMVLIAVAIKFDTSGPVFYCQERIGKGFRPFRLYKFRSMVVGADQQGLQLTAGADVRITRIGRWLRRTKFDELPQLLNVLKGEMSLVGPRPEVRKYVEMFRDDFREILQIRPGITDYAAIAFRNEQADLAKYADPEKGYVNDILPRKIELYRSYLANLGILEDMKILLRTMRIIFAHRG